MVRLVLFPTIAAIFLAASAQAEDALPKTTPQQAGFSVERLKRLDAWCEDLVASQKYSGITVLLARDGKILEWQSFGYGEKPAGRKLENDNIFAIASLTKLVTTVAALTLVEEGKLTLREPVLRYLPKFERMKVFAGGTADSPTLVDARRPMTLHDLLTQTAGFYSSSHAEAQPVLAELWKRSPQASQTLAEMAERLASFPLLAHPGEAWIYGPATDLVGALIERVTGRPFDRFVDDRVLRPLRMRDTSFEVPEAKRARQVFMDARQADGSLKSEAPKCRAGSWPSGGGGLFSTVGDYVRFAQMLLNGGELDGVRILSPKTVDLMTRDHLHGLPKPTKIYPVSDGFGYGVEIRTDLARSGWLGTEGTFGWNGATTCYCSIDPQEKLIAMIWAQHQPNAEFDLYERFNNLVYQALVKPK